MTGLAELYDDYEFLDADDRYRLLIELGRDLEDIPRPVLQPISKTSIFSQIYFENC